MKTMRFPPCIKRSSSTSERFKFPPIHSLFKEQLSSLSFTWRFHVFEKRYQYPPFSFIRYSFDNVHLFPASLPNNGSNEKYKIEYKSVLCQIHSNAIFFNSCSSGVQYFSVEDVSLQTAYNEERADAVYWVKSSMKYFDILNDSLCSEQLFLFSDYCCKVWSEVEKENFWVSILISIWPFL